MIIPDMGKHIIESKSTFSTLNYSKYNFILIMLYMFDHACIQWETFLFLAWKISQPKLFRLRITKKTNFKAVFTSHRAKWIKPNRIVNLNLDDDFVN